jgi:uncharacterized protein
MNDLLRLYESLKDTLSPEQQSIILREISADREHYINNPAAGSHYRIEFFPGAHTSVMALKTLEELLEKDKTREEDGFQPKIRIGKVLRPGKKGDIRVVPTTVEEKFLHDNRPPTPYDEDPDSGGSGEGEEGEVIGKKPLHREGGGSNGPGQGEGGEHDISSSAYDLGKILSEKFKLPNLEDKNKKVFSGYRYDLTDRNQGSGQILDYKRSLRKILQTNIALGRIPDVTSIDPSTLLVDPRDKVYKILSEERDFESQAIVFFLRDYSGSMGDVPTDTIVSQHLLIYSWLLYQYNKRVETRFIVHDTKAEEVPDFYTYYNITTGGGTAIISAYQLVNSIVEKEGLAKDYNIYIFHGTDGDDFTYDNADRKTLEEMVKITDYASRFGITIAEAPYAKPGNTVFESYVRKSRILDVKSKYIKLDSMPEKASQQRIIDGIYKLLS